MRTIRRPFPRTRRARVGARDARRAARRRGGREAKARSRKTRRRLARSASRAGTEPSRARARARARRAARRTGAFPARSGAPRTATRSSPPGRARAGWHPPRRNRRRYPSASTRTMAPTWRRPSATASRRTSRSGTGRRRSRFRGRKRTCRGTRAALDDARTSRDEPEVARAVARRARARDSKAAGPVAAGGFAAAARRSTPPPLAAASEASEEPSPPPPDASPGARAARARAPTRGAPGFGGGNLPFEAVRRRASLRALGDAARYARDVGVPSASAAVAATPARRRRATRRPRPTSRASASSASFSDRQRAMVGRGVQEARTRASEMNGRGGSEERERGALLEAFFVFVWKRRQVFLLGTRPTQFPTACFGFSFYATRSHSLRRDGVRVAEPEARGGAARGRARPRRIRGRRG